MSNRNFFLFRLASTDLLFNLTLASRCAHDFLDLNSMNFCRLLSFLSHLAELLSAGFTVHFTIQRFIAVKFPLSVFIEKNFHHLHSIIIGLFVLLGVAFCSALVSQNQYEFCQEELELFWFIFDAILSFFVPFSIIAVLNLLIIIHLRTSFKRHQTIPSRQQRRSFDSSSFYSRYSETSNTGTKKFETFLSVEPRTSRAASIRSTRSSHAQSHRVTRMLILVSTCFLFLNAPSHILTITLKFYSLRPTPMNRTRINSFLLIYILMIISQHISFLSYSINFFLYSFCGKKFRHEFLRFIPKCFFKRSN